MRLYNIEPYPVVVGGWGERAVMPGEGRDFDQISARYLLGTGRWSRQDPRAGLDAERAFKAKRDQITNPGGAPDKGATRT